MPWLCPRSMRDASRMSPGPGPQTPQSRALHTGATLQTTSPAAEFIRQHPNSRHCVIPSWTGERQPRGDKGFIVHWVHAPAQHTTPVAGLDAVLCHRDLLSPGDRGAPSGPTSHRRGSPCFSAGASSPRSSFQREVSSPACATVLCRAQAIPGSFAQAGAARAAAPTSICSWGAPGPLKPAASPGNPLIKLTLVLSELKGGRSGYGQTNALLAGEFRLSRWGHGGTHHFEVFGGALLPTEEAGQQHLPDVVASPVVKLQHVKRFGLEVSEVCLVLQDFQLLLIGGLGVRDLVS